MTSGTMTRAAELMQISQPAVSNLIASLEYEIGFKLFERLKGRLRPTPEAGFFYAEVTQALSGLERAAEKAGNIRSGRRGYLTLLTDPSIAIEFMPTVLSRFMREREGVKVRLLTRNAWVLQEMIPAPAIRHRSFRFGGRPPSGQQRDTEVKSASAHCLRAIAFAGKAPSRPAIWTGSPLYRCFASMPLTTALRPVLRRRTRHGTWCRKSSTLPLPALSCAMGWGQR